jgi:integrase
MVRAIHRLSARQAETLRKPGRHADGGNLYLAITPQGAKRWVFMYRLHGKQREMGLGSAAKGRVSLTTARNLAQDARDLLAEGRDPITERRALGKVPHRSKTFGEIADEYIKAMRPSWRSAIHASQWEYTLKELAAPLRSKPVNQIETQDILEVLKPLWTRIPETASRLRGRIENVLDAAKASNQRHGENPARWRGHLDKLLAKRAKHTRSHYAALPYDQVKDCIAKLREKNAMTARALEFCILTASRAGETLGARWGEIDLDKALWTIPAARMKAGVEHRVPLATRPLEILKALSKCRLGALVFPGSSPRNSLSETAMRQMLRRIGYANATVHGFRSAFRDWAAEATGFPHQVAEMALAHTISNQVEAAYRRGDLFDKRRKLMAAWAEYIEPREGGKVLALTPQPKR